MIKNAEGFVSALLIEKKNNDNGIVVHKTQYYDNRWGDKPDGNGSANISPIHLAKRLYNKKQF